MQQQNRGHSPLIQLPKTGGAGARPWSRSSGAEISGSRYNSGIHGDCPKALRSGLPHHEGTEATEIPVSRTVCAILLGFEASAPCHQLNPGEWSVRRCYRAGQSDIGRICKGKRLWVRHGLTRRVPCYSKPVPVNSER